MKTTWVLWSLLLLATVAGAQVKKNDAGLYVDADGRLYTGELENKEDGVITWETTIVAGLPQGDATYYYKTGKMMETGYFQAGKMDGKWLRYNENGVLIGLAIYKDGKKDGTWMVWDDKGKKRFETHYNNGDKIGVWSNWDENGALIASKDYSHVN